jgi:hypothetical protein
LVWSPSVTNSRKLIFGTFFAWLLGKARMFSSVSLKPAAPGFPGWPWPYSATALKKLIPTAPIPSKLTGVIPSGVR